MNWIQNHKRTLLHINLAFIGGLTGAYAILVRGGNFGAAQTMNLIEMVLNFAEMNLTDALLRLAIFVLYGLAILAAFLIGERFPSSKAYIALVIEAVCVWIAGVIPVSVNPLIALFPVFILNAYQWQTFTDPECYNSSTIFSTNNYKQTILSWTRYHINHDLAQKKKSLAFYQHLDSFPPWCTRRIFCSYLYRCARHMDHISAACFCCFPGSSFIRKGNGKRCRKSDSCGPEK
ncbi:MAG: YoaK family protein [Dorea sp.]